MKGVLVGIFMVGLMLLTACGQNASVVQAEDAGTPTWQEQYDLGIRYLSEGKYEEAIIAFTAAIEIDPKQAPAYVGRGDAYIGSGKTEESLAAARADYEKALELDSSLVDVYLSLANVYVSLEENDTAINILQDGYEITANEQLIQRKEELTAPPLNSYGEIEFTARDGYVPYEDLSDVQKSFINKVIVALENEDRSAMESALEERPIDLFPYHFYISTQTKDYKVRITIFRGGTQIEAEVRAENGMGYFAGIGAGHTTSGQDTYHWAYSTCPCSNWQPDGSYHKYEEVAYLDDEMTVYYDVTGIARQGIVVGAETWTETKSLHSEMQEPTVSIHYYDDDGLRTYQNGIGGPYGPLNPPFSFSSSIWW